MWSALTALSWSIVSFILVAGGRISLKGKSREGAGMVEALNAVLGNESLLKVSVILITERNSWFDGVAELRESWGAAVFKTVGYNQDANVTQKDLLHVIGHAWQVQHVSKAVTVAVVSDNPAFLAAFTELSLKGRLLVWSTKLLVLTRLPLHRLHLLSKILAMTNSMVLQLSFSPILRCDMYVYHPYSDQRSRPQSVVSWIQNKGLIFRIHQQVFPPKFNTLSQRPNLLVVWQPLSSTSRKVVDDPTAPKGKRVALLSSKITLLETLAKELNFTFKLVSAIDGSWGRKLPNGTWTGMMGMVIREEVDIGLGFYGITAQRAEALDFTYPLAIAYGRILVGRGNPEVDPWGFLLPLTPLVWVVILVALLGMLAVMMLLHFCLPVKTLRRTKLLANTANCFRVLLQQDVAVGTQWSERVMLGVWMLTTLVLTRSYAGNLMSLLAVRYFPMPIQSLQDVIDSPVTFVVLKGTVKTQAFLVMS